MTKVPRLMFDIFDMLLISKILLSKVTQSYIHGTTCVCSATLANTSHFFVLPLIILKVKFERFISKEMYNLDVNLELVQTILIYVKDFRWSSVSCRT